VDWGPHPAELAAPSPGVYSGAMRLGTPLRALLLSACLAAWGPAPAAADPAEFLPVRSAAYDEIEVLAARGLLDSLRIYTRPLVRIDVANALLRARRLHPEVEQNLNYRRLERELARELTDLGYAPEQAETGPLADWRGGDTRFRIQSEAHVRGDYDETREDAHYRLRDESALGARMALQARPGFGALLDMGITRIRSEREFIDALAVRTDVEFAALHAELTGRVGPVTAAAGYDYFRWGPGRRGTLLLADAAGPMGFLSIQGNVAGRVVGTAVSGILSYAESRMFAAHRLEVAPTPWLSVGLAEAVRYTNSGIDLLYGIGLLPYSLIERIHVREASTDSIRSLQRSNVMASADASVRISPNLTLYGELLVDDFTTEDESMPDRFAWQAGFRSDRPIGGGMIHFLGEYARVRNYTYSVYYDQNFIYRDRPLGYVLGPDVEDVWIEVGYDLSRDWQVRWSGDFINKGEGQLGVAWNPAQGPVSDSGLSGVVEERREVWGDVRWLPRDNVDLSVGAGYRRRENVNHVSGVTEGAWLARLAAELRY
jgi:capsule assembly protein Wzi